MEDIAHLRNTIRRDLVRLPPEAQLAILSAVQRIGQHSSVYHTLSCARLFIDQALISQEKRNRHERIDA